MKICFYSVREGRAKFSRLSRKKDAEFLFVLILNLFTQNGF